MLAKVAEREKALELRNQGLSYSEILKQVHVAKSSLSSWLPNVHLNSSQKERIRQKLLIAQKLGASVKKKQRIDKTLKIKQEAVSEIQKINNKELFYMGVMLYWAEGAKERNSISQIVDFSNSDPRMNKLFLKWLQSCLSIPKDEITFNIYIHESQKERVGEVLNYWSKVTGFPKGKFGKTSFTKTVYPRKRKRKDNGKYYGQLRIKVRRSTDLNRKIAGWVDGICQRSGVSG